MDLPPDEIEYEEVHISDDDTATIVTVVAACFFVAFVAVTLRLISRRLKHQHLLKDDFMILVALVFAVALSVTISIDLYAGLGKHVVFSNHVPTFLKSSLATQVLYITSLIPLKLSLIFFYCQFSTNTLQRLALWLLGIWAFGIGLAGDLTMIISCAEAPIVRTNVHCVNYKIAVLSHGGQDALTNLLLLVWPTPFIWGAKIDRIRKLHLVGVFALGAFACAASIIRLLYASNFYEIDQTWSLIAPTIWCQVELTVGLAAASLAPLTPILQCALPSYSQATATTKRNHSFISDTETAVALPNPTSATISNGKRTRAISLKASSTTTTTTTTVVPTMPSTPSRWKRSFLTKNKTSSGASSPGFTWRCSGRPSDLEKWKALPPPPLPSLPGEVHVGTGRKISNSAAGENKELVEEEWVEGEPQFRAVHYGGNI